MQTSVGAPVADGEIQEKVANPITGVSAGLVSDRRVVPFYERALPKLDRRGRDPASYALHLGFWDAKTHRYRQAIDNENRALAGKARIERDDRVLDAGCGFGASSLWLAGEIGARVVGIDLAPSQIFGARRLAASAGPSVLESVEFHRADFCRTGFSPDSFDVVWAVESVCHAANKGRFLVEAYRLLKPGGRLIVADLFRSARPLDSEEEALAGRWLAGWAIPDLLTEGEFAAAARTAGFSGQSFVDATAEVWPSLRRLHRRALLAYPLAGLLMKAGVLSEERLAAILSGRLQFEALGRGLWSYGLFTATKAQQTVEGQEEGRESPKFERERT